MSMGVYLRKIVKVFAGLIICCFVQQALSAKNVYLAPGNYGDTSKGWLGQAAQELLRMGYALHPRKKLKKLKKPQATISFEVSPRNCVRLARENKRALLMLYEPPSVIPENYDQQYHAAFRRVYTWRDDLVDNKKYFKLFYFAMQPMIPNRVLFAAKKLCVLVNANKTSGYPSELYSEGRRVIDFYQQYHPSDFDLYGSGWDRRYSVYKGVAGDKLTCLNSYKFCICYENVADQPGYITEKIFDCFAAGCVPIYWGAPNVTDYIPKNCFIDRRDFGSDAAVYEHIKSMPESVFNKYIANIKTFLASPQGQLFAEKNYVPFFISVVLEAEKLG
jgi:hypothetical protein